MAKNNGLPDLNVVGWIKGRGKAKVEWAYRKPKSWASIGEIETGKSASLETIASQYAVNGSTIIDLYGARDSEGLAWLRSPFKESVCLLKGRSVEVDSEYPVVNALDFKLKDLEKYRVIISPACLYNTLNEEWFSIGKLIEKLWHRHFWKIPCAILVREASNLLYSRQSLGDTQYLAKAHMIAFVREMRHCGFAVLLDTQRWKAVDINFRSVDFLFIKGQGIEGLSGSGIGWIYSYFDPRDLQKLEPDQAIMICRRGPVAYVEFEFPSWHKLEAESMPMIFDIEPRYKGLVDYGEVGFRRVGDPEHARIMRIRMEKKGDRGRKISMGKIAKGLGKSPRTIQEHIKKHNLQVRSFGSCDICEKVKGQYASEIVPTKN